MGRYHHSDIRCRLSVGSDMTILQQLYLFLLHPLATLFQDHHYRCKRCGLFSSHEADLCEPEYYKFSDYDYGD